MIKPTRLAVVMSLLICVHAVNGFCEEPTRVTFCDLAADPTSYNHKLVQVTGFIEHGFESFSAVDPSCRSEVWLWLEYGGNVASGTIYCCGVDASRRRTAPFEVEGVKVPLVDDERFRTFDRLVQRRPDSMVHATIEGIFFSGRAVPHQDPFGAGFGHFGCCTLLAIQRVVSVDAKTDNDLDYRAYPDQPDGIKSGCSFGDILTENGRNSRYRKVTQAQRQAEQSGNEWSFLEPERAAAEILVSVAEIKDVPLREIKEARKAPGRRVYEWHTKAKDRNFLVVMSRPYWMTFFAKDPKKVAWLPIAVYESGCSLK